MDRTLKDKCAIAGIGWTKYTKASGVSTLALAAEACKKAIDDSGLPIDEVDGIVTHNMNDSCSPQDVAASLGLPELRWHEEHWVGGAGSARMVAEAAMAIICGMATNVVCFRAMNGRSGRRLGGTGERPSTTGEGQFLYPYGWTSFIHACCLFASRHMALYGTTERQLGAIAIAQHKHAMLNDRAMLRKPITMDDYLNSKMIAYPFHIYDITLETDGACAVLVTTSERAKDLKKKPVYIMSAAHGGGPDNSAFDMNSGAFLRTPEPSNMYSHYVAKHLFGMAGITPQDVDVAEIYDEVTMAALVQLEDFGFCKKGEGGPFVESGAIELGGKLPLNTHGGFLCEGYIHGINHVAEAVQQLRGECGARQVKDAEIAITSGVGITVGSALLLRR